MMASNEHDFVVLGAKDIQDFNDGGLLPLVSEDIDKIQRWLLPTDYSADSSEYGKHLASYLPGTGNWILETENYTRWHDSSEIGSLWIKAIPGAGKSVYAAHLASKIASQESVPVLYFFFRQIITANQKPHSLVRDYLSQLLSYSPWLQCKLKKFIDDRRSLDSVSFDELWQTLQSAMSLLPRVYCVADALDEMNTGNESFMGTLVRLGQLAPASIKVLMTSRPVPRVEKVLNQQTVLQIILQQQLVDQDIAIYVKHRLDGSKISAYARSTVLQIMCARANGLFLYARLMMDNLLDPGKNSFADMETLLDTLNKLPTSLAEMYTGMLREHSERSGVPQAMQLIILRWVTQAERPLRLLELAGMIDFEQKTFGKSQDTKSMLRAGCGPLLEILEDETISVIHHSFTEFLFDTERNIAISELDRRRQFPRLDYAKSQRAIAVTCINYLTSDWLDDWGVRPKAQVVDNINSWHTPQDIKLKYPFLDYAAMNWHRHLVKYGRADEELFLLLDDFLIENTRALRFWLDLTLPAKKFYKVTPMHVAADKNLSHYIEHLIHLEHEIECMNDTANTPISVAAMKGNHETVALLLKNGAQIDRDDHYGLKPLIYAATANHHLVVKLLLEAGVDPFSCKTKEDPGRWCGNAPTTIGDTAVEYACQYGHVETIRVFMPHLNPNGLQIALYWATRFGSTKVVMALLESPYIDINSATRGKTPVYLAAAAYDITTMRVLLEKGADVRTMCDNDFSHGGVGCWSGDGDNKKYTPLHAFARACSKQLRRPKEQLRLKEGFELLLKAGCGVDAVDGSGSTALHSLISRGYRSPGADSCLEDVISYLLSQGASATALTADGSTVLHLLSSASITLVNLLIKNGADVNAIRESDGKSPLMTSLERCGRGVEKVLLAHGADCSLTDLNGWTPLHFLISQYSVDKDVCETILRTGANPNARNHEGNTPLHLNRHVSVEVLSLFLQYKVCLEAKNNKGQTIFLKSLENKALVEAGVDVHAVDFKGSTAMHLACTNINPTGTTTTQLLRYLAEKGVDPKRTDNDGNTLLHEAAKHPADYHQQEQANLLSVILEFGISPRARNRYGQTALHLAFSHAESHYPNSPLDFLLGPKCNLDVNVADMKGIRPLHLTASFNESLTMRLLKLGADPTVTTIEGQSPLMIACRTRRSNLVGLLVDHYIEHGQCALIDCVDFKGRSALHYASRSGRHETVKILLAAGANPNLKDKSGVTPLLACAEFSVEDENWTDPEKSNGWSERKAAYVLLGDKSRPSASKHSDPVGIRESLQLLVAYGADVSFLDNNKDSPPSDFQWDWNRSGDPLETAIIANCEAMVDELLSMGKRNSTSESTASSEDNASVVGPCSSRLSSFSGELLRLKSRYMPDILSRIVKRGESRTDIVRDLLRLGHQPGVIELKRLGADFLRPDGDGESSITIIVRWGFVSLMETVGTDASKMNEAWIKDAEATNPNLLGKLRPILPIACERELPNLEMIRLLVEKFGVDLSEFDVTDRNSSRPRRSVLHILAKAAHWWQPKALEYLIKRGADIEAKDSNGDTALLVALIEDFGGHLPYARTNAIKVLLHAGANPNVLDKDGLTCLNRAAKQHGAVRLLVEHGANPILGKRPFIFDAIEAMDLVVITILVESGVDCNIQVHLENEDESRSDDEDEGLGRRRRVCHRTQLQYSLEGGISYPIHFAASSRFNTDELKSKMIPIIETLLVGGANPFLICSNGDSILHNLARDSGILEPFFALSNIDFNARDSKGRTLFLAACSSGGHWDRGQSITSDTLSLFASHNIPIDAVDNECRNALHCIISSHQENRGVSESLENVLSLPGGSALVAARDAEGCTPLHYALRNHSLDIVETLLQHGANLGEPDPIDGSTALHHTAKAFSSKYVKNYSKLFSTLLARDLDINARDSSGETALFRFFAMPSPASDYHQYSYIGIFPIFEDAGADVKVRNNRGEGLLHRLASHWYKEKEKKADTVAMFRKLLEKGCDPAWEDEKQRTCLDVAAAAGNQAVLELFQRNRIPESVPAKGGIINLPGGIL